MLCLLAKNKRVAKLHRGGLDRYLGTFHASFIMCYHRSAISNCHFVLPSSSIVVC